MSEVSVINISNKKEIIPERVSRVIDFFRQSSLYLNLIFQACKYNLIKVPDIFSEGYAECNKSLFMQAHVLKFESVFSGESFYIIQFRSSFFSLYIPSENIVYCAGGSVSQHQNLVNSLKRYMVGKFEAGDFNGMILSDSRPYHFFYDCMSAYLYYVDRFPSIRSYPVHGKHGHVWLDVDDFLSSRDPFTKTSLASDFNTSGFFLYSGRHIDSEYKERSLEIFSRTAKGVLIPKEIDFKRGLSKESPVIWIGLSEEKRRWIERDDFLNIFFEDLSKWFISPVIIFDGLTKPCGVDEASFERQLKNNEQLINKLSNFFRQPKIVDLNGKSSLEKIAYARDVDFFFSNALTDSIWCSKFFGKVGVAISSRGSLVKHHAHKLTYLIDNKRVKDLSIGEDSHFSEVSFSCSPEYVKDIALSSLIVNFLHFNRVYVSADPDQALGTGKVVYSGGVDGFFEIVTSEENPCWFSIKGGFNKEVSSGYGYASTFRANFISIKFSIEIFHGELNLLKAVFYSEDSPEKIVSEEVHFFGEEVVFSVPKEARFFEIGFSCSSRVVGILNGVRVQPLFEVLN